MLGENEIEKIDETVENMRVREYRITKKDKLDYGLIERLANLQCTNAEIAYAIGVHPVVFCNWKKKDEQLVEALETGYATGKISLRRAQMDIALPRKEEGYNGNASMLIWLGKNVLNQSDKLKVGGDGDQPINIKLGWGDLPKPEENNKSEDDVNENED